jgi:flagellar biosynthesis protein FlhG
MMDDMGSADQAARLRQLFGKQGVASSTPREGTRVLAVSGGKGGVGKTNVTANLAIAFAAMGLKVAVLDADWALANIDILLGFNPRYTMEHVLDGSMSVGEIIMDGPGGIKVVPAASGVQHLSHLDERQRNHLFNALQVLEKHFNNLLIDTAAGMSDEVITILRASGEVIIVTNPEPPAFVDSYALIKHLLSHRKAPRLRLVVNQVRNEAEALGVYDRIAKTVDKFLSGTVEYLGYVAEDEAVKKSVRERKPFILQYPNSRASRCVAGLAQRLARDGASPAGEQQFWNNLKNVIKGRAAAR